jgi:hypothetical protein
MAEKIHAMHGRDHCPGGADPIPCLGGGGQAIFEIKVFEEPLTVTVGDGAFIFEIPEDLDDAILTKCEAWITTVSSSGIVQVQLRNVTTGFDMLTTKISIDVGEKNSKDAATQPVIDTARDDVNWGDHIAIDVDAAGVGAKGLGLILYFLPAATVALALQGQQGPAGGITAWEGPWVTATGYSIGDAVSHNGSSYVARINHTSAATTEPGVGATWQTAWMLLAGGQQVSSLQAVMDGGPYILETGIKGFMHVPFPCTIIEATLLANITGNLVVDIWKDTYGNFPPTVADTITASAKPTLSSAIKTTDTTLTGWSKNLATGDVLAFNIDSVTLISKATLALRVTRT